MCLLTCKAGIEVGFSVVKTLVKKWLKASTLCKSSWVIMHREVVFH